jgi:hypothetical protein
VTDIGRELSVRLYFCLSPYRQAVENQTLGWEAGMNTLTVTCAGMHREVNVMAASEPSRRSRDAGSHVKYSDSVQRWMEERQETGSRLTDNLGLAPKHRVFPFPVQNVSLPPPTHFPCTVRQSITPPPPPSHLRIITPLPRIQKTIGLRYRQTRIPDT